MSVVCPHGETSVVYTKGAPEAVLQRCVAESYDGSQRPLDDEQRERLDRRLDDLARQGLRLIACARRLTTPAADAAREDVERELTLLGFVALSDPLRDAVSDAVRRAHRAGITVHVISGDNGATAGAIARSAGIGAGHPRVVTGTELDAMDDAALDALLADQGLPSHEGETVFARSSPEDKLRIATRLQARGHVVAMTGDGVNDAPALRRADIGVAMGASGTDVAREAATMVLTDDDFSTIIGAVESGRRVYDNVRKFILYIFAHAVPEVVPFLIFALSGGAIPLALTVPQILMIDLGTETLPALALGREAAEPGIMNRPPRRRTESIITGSLLLRAWGILGVVSAVLVTSAFLWSLARNGWIPGADVSSGSPLHDAYAHATTLAFAGIVVCQIGTAMAARTDRVSLLRIGILTNRLLLVGIAFELVVAAAAIYLPVAHTLLGTRPLGLDRPLRAGLLPGRRLGSRRAAPLARPAAHRTPHSEPAGGRVRTRARPARSLFRGSPGGGADHGGGQEFQILLTTRHTGPTGYQHAGIALYSPGPAVTLVAGRLFVWGCGKMGGRALSLAPEEIDMSHRRTDGSRAESPAIRLLDALRNGDDLGVIAVCGDNTVVHAENLRWSCQGRDEIHRWLVEAREHFPGLTIESHTRHIGFGLVIDEARVQDVGQDVDQDVDRSRGRDPAAAEDEPPEGLRSWPPT